jgi:ferritin-like metal-binding protein YciE
MNSSLFQRQLASLYSSFKKQFMAKRKRVKSQAAASKKAKRNGRAAHTPSRGMRRKTIQAADGKTDGPPHRRQRMKHQITSNLYDLLKKNLQGMYAAEKQILAVLPEFTKASFSAELKRTFQLHTSHTRKHVERLERIFEKLKSSPGPESCPLIEGLLDECRNIIRLSEPGAVRDAELIMSVQKIEHYEMAVYGSLFELAEVLGHFRIADIIDRILAEEESTDKHLSQIAKHVNDEAMRMDKNSMKYDRISLN